MEWNKFFEFAFTHQRSFYFLTASECLIFAFVILIPSYKKHFSGVRRWANFFALTFLILGLMYLARYLNLKSDHEFPNDLSTEIIRFILSGFSNLFLFLTAIFIRKDFAKTKLFSKEMFIELIKGWQGVGFVVIISGSISAVLAKTSNSDFTKTILEIPDHVASCFVLLWFGYTVFRELGFRRSRIFAAIALFSLVIYAGAFAFQGIHLINFNITNSWNLAPGRVSAAITFISFFLKAGLFFPTYFLITSTSNDYKGIHEMLEEITTNRVEFLESEGILKKVIEIFKADEIILTILLPGKTRSLISTYQFPSTDEYKEDPQRKPKITLRGKGKPGLEEKICEQIFYENRVLTYNVHKYPDNLHKTLIPKFESLKTNEKVSVIATPIRYHGAVIGSLEIYLRTSPLKPSFSRTDVLQIQRVAILLTRVVQANREVAGIDQLITRLGSLQTDQTDLSLEKLSETELSKLQSDKSALSRMAPDVALNNILTVLDDLFNPIALGIYTNIGFKSEIHTFPKDTEYKEKIETNLRNGTPEKLEILKMIPVYNKLTVPSFENFRFLREEKDVKQSERDRTFGQLIAVTHEENDEFNSPTLFTYHLLSRVVSNIVVDNYLDFTRDFLNAHLKDLTVQLNAPENSNISTWFNIVEGKIHEVNLLWAVVTKNEVLEESLGENLNFIKQIQENNEPIYESEIINLYYNEATIINKANSIIRLKLEKFSGALWLGVERKGFGSEIEKYYKASPWKTFLESLADISDTTLYRIIDKAERDQNAKSAAEFHGLATTAITTGTLLHQVSNQVKEVTFPINVLKNSLNLGKLRGTKESWQRIFNLIDATKKLEELTQLLSGIVKTDSHRPCKLGEIIEESQKLFDSALEQYNIKLVNTLTSEFLSKEIDVPFYVGSFALTNLVVNAKDAIKINKIPNGIIKIEAEENGTSVLFHVIDNGPGVPKEFQSRIFEKGVTTKTDTANFSTGLGLFFTAISLSENGALVQLTSPGPNPPTKFTINFPKPRKEIL